MGVQASSTAWLAEVFIFMTLRETENLAFGNCELEFYKECSQP
jgi:hypothetical protein